MIVCTRSAWRNSSPEIYAVGCASMLQRLKGIENRMSGAGKTLNPKTQTLNPKHTKIFFTHLIPYDAKKGANLTLAVAQWKECG